MNLPHNPSLNERVNNVATISQNMNNNHNENWNQINIGGPYLPTFAQSQEYALDLAKELSNNKNSGGNGCSDLLGGKRKKYKLNKSRKHKFRKSVKNNKKSFKNKRITRKIKKHNKKLKMKTKRVSYKKTKRKIR